MNMSALEITMQVRKEEVKTKAYQAQRFTHLSYIAIFHFKKCLSGENGVCVKI